jgi:predicted GNAT family acetyltransferase
MDEIKHEPAGHKGAFVWRRDGELLAHLTYSVAGTRVILDHTEVDDRLRGTGAGKKLVAFAVEWARQEKTKLMPLCPFAKSVFAKTPELRDVLAE